MLTPVDNFPKDVGAVGGRTVPAAVTKLPFAFFDGCVQACCNGVQDARVLPDQFSLTTT